MLLYAALLSFLAHATPSRGAVTVPGVVPRAYGKGGEVAVSVNKLMSVKTQIPFDYYKLPYCRLDVHEATENIGQRLAGDKLESSGYKVRMRLPKACSVLCKRTLSEADAGVFRKFIDDEYRVSMMVDTLPVLTAMENGEDPAHPWYVRGYPVGFSLPVAPGSSERMHFLYNHLRFILRYNDERVIVSPGQPGTNPAHIVGFEVVPMSVRHTYDEPTFDPATSVLGTCNEMNHAENSVDTLLEVKPDQEVIYTYDVVWEPSDTIWTERWDIYLRGGPSDTMHWFSIVNSTLVVLFLSTMVAIILIRTLRRDIAAYNDDDAEDEGGWKLMHTEVFRPPQNGKLLFSVIVGTGVQLTLLVFATLCMALVGVVSPAHRGYLVTALVVLYVLTGSVAGYYSARTYKMFRGTNWRLTTLTTAVAFPGFLFVCFIVADVALASQGSSAAVPAITWFVLILMGCGICAPLVFVGSYSGYRKELQELPCRVNLIARAIPEQPWYFHPAVVSACSGLLPFGAVSVELFFVLSAMWLNQIYYIFGFLFLTMVILVVTVMEMSIVTTYFQLCAADHRWHWRSVYQPGACAGYCFLFTWWYYAQELSVSHGVTTLLYTISSLALSVSIFLITGAAGYLASDAFVRKIYSSIKCE